MIVDVLAVLGVVFLVFLLLAGIGFLLDRPQSDERLRIELEAQQTAWRIQMQTRAAIEQMLDEARRSRNT